MTMIIFLVDAEKLGKFFNNVLYSNKTFNKYVVSINLT